MPITKLISAAFPYAKLICKCVQVEKKVVLVINTIAIARPEASSTEFEWLYNRAVQKIASVYIRHTFVRAGNQSHSSFPANYLSGTKVLPLTDIE